MSRYSRHKAGLSDRRQKLATGVVFAPSPAVGFNQPVTDCVTLVFNKLNGHAILGSGLNGIVTKCQGLVFNLLNTKVTQ